MNNVSGVCQSEVVCVVRPVMACKLRNQDYDVLTGTDRGGESRGQITHTLKKFPRNG